MLNFSRITLAGGALAGAGIIAGVSAAPDEQNRKSLAVVLCLTGATLLAFQGIANIHAWVKSDPLKASLPQNIVRWKQGGEWNFTKITSPADWNKIGSAASHLELTGFETLQGMDLTRFSSVKIFSLNRCGDLSGLQIPPSVTQLNLTRLSLTDETFRSILGQELRKITAFCCEGLTTSALSEISLPSLEEVSLSYVSELVNLERSLLPKLHTIKTRQAWGFEQVWSWPTDPARAEDNSAQNALWFVAGARFGPRIV